MAIRAKSVVFVKDGRYITFTKVYNTEQIPPNHIDLVDIARRKGLTDKDFLAVTESTYDPFTIDIYPIPSEKASLKIATLVKSDMKRKLKNNSIIQNKQKGR